MKRRPSRPVWILAIAMLALVALPGLASAQEGESFGHVWEVTITNLTYGQIISPPIVYSHRGGFDLFTPGDPAIPELAAVAEDADSGDLLDLLNAEPRVLDVAIADGVLLPGESTTVHVTARGLARRVTALGMLVTTNDAFFAAEGWAVGFGSNEYALAWDAGSEANTQSCDHIPGPPCNNPFVRVTEGSEGYVFVHSGIHSGVGDLEPAMHDWRNPVAKVTLRRAKF